MYMKEWGLAKFKPVYVVHCPQSFGIVIEHKSGIKISYSGDCRPTLQFIEEAANSTLMIHEATFGDDLL
jgi:ribonuclease Z